MTRARWLGLLVLLVIGAAALATLGVITTRRHAVEQRSDGRLCVSCHDAPPHEGGHATFDCDGCHRVDDALALDLALAREGLMLPPPHDETQPCTTCHDSSPTSALAAEGHRAHASATPDCSSCHTDPHGAAAPRTCESCHADVALHGPTRETPCTTCHAFRPAAPDDAVLPEAAVAHEADLAGVHPIEIGADRVHGAMDCRRCHDPHADDEAPTTVRCEDCHRGHLGEEQETAPLGHQSCTGCHEPHAPRATPAVDCLQCHAYPAEGHGWDARPPTATGPAFTEAEQAATRARITHEGRCATCHEPHTWAASPTRCASCHEENAATIAALPAGAHGACATCHEAHEPQPTGQVCRSCHADVHASGAGTPAAHQDCLSCHDAHEGRPSAAVACASCHQSEHVQLVRSTVQHRDCLSCHEQHGAPLGPTPGACASCHTEPALAFASAPRASVPAEHQCASCHRPHEFLADAGAITRCATCHTDVVSAHASHRGTCTSCHEEHGAPLGQAPDCASCHDDVHPSVASHADCRACHQPHQAAADALRRCESCHATEARASASWPASSPHRADCMACHQAHDEPTQTACASCHAERASRAHMGGHTDCTGCHEPHRAPPATPSGWWARCADCHRPEATAVTGLPGTHGDCASCHQTPGPPLPTCQSCHAAPRPLAHAAHAAQSCSACHTAHGRPAIERGTCTACHTDRADHFPDAARCQSCHPFGD